MRHGDSDWIGSHVAPPGHLHTVVCGLGQQGVGSCIMASLEAVILLALGEPTLVGLPGLDSTLVVRATLVI